MRTTLTLEADVAKGLERLRRQRDASMKEVVNQALRAGLLALAQSEPAREAYRTPTSAGRPRLPDIDNIADVIALVEGESHA